MQNDDFSFAEDAEQNEGDSFVEVFDADLFEKESKALLVKKKPPRVVDGKQKRSFFPQDQLDLHGCRAAEAKMKVESFLATARGKGFGVVRVITGKGLHSEGGAVLPDVVEGMLVEMKARRRIEDFSWENKAKEESGAVIVYW